MASLPHDRESFLSTQLKSATVEDDAECGKKTCPLDRIPLFDAEDEVDDEIELPSMEEMFEMANDRIRALEANIVAVQEPFRAMRRMVEKSFHNIFMSNIEKAATQAQVEEVCDTRRIMREVFQNFRTNEGTLWSAFATKFLEYAAQHVGREVDSLDPGQLPDVLLFVQAKKAQYAAAKLDFKWMLENVMLWGDVSVEDLLRGLGMADALQGLHLGDEDEQHEHGQQEDGQHEDRQHEDDLEEGDLEEGDLEDHHESA